MNRCPITYSPCGDNRYSGSGLKQLSPRLSNLKEIEYSAEEQRREAFNRAARMSVQGVQPKLSARLNIREEKIDIVDTGGRYILKPQHPFFPEMPENEDLTMKLAGEIDLITPLHGLVWSKDNSLTYFIRRFDRKGHKSRIAVEDFAQLAGMSRETKYDYSMEKVVGLINKFCTFPAIEKLVLVKMVIFNYITGNDDMHLKNFSVITEDGIVRLSPCYDLLNTTILYREPGDEIALPLKGRKRNLTYNNLVRYFAVEKCDLTERSIERIMETISSAIPRWKSITELSFLSEEMKSRYLELMDIRLNNLNIT